MKKSTLFIALLLTAFTFQLSHAQWTTSGTNIYNSNSGRIGVGTTAPAYKLDVNGNLNADTLQNTVVAASTSAGIQKIRGGDVEITIDHKNSSALQGAFEIFNGTGAHCLNMWETGVSTFYNSMTIQNPNTSAYSAALTLQGSGIYGPSMMFKNTGAGGIDWSLTTRDDGTLNFVKVEGSTHTPLKIEPNGRVSLGAQTPVAKLHVQNYYSGNYGGTSFSRALEGTSTDSVGIHDGVLGKAQGLSSYGVWGINNRAGAYAGYFSGNLGYTGTLTGPSDRKLKDDIEHLEGVLGKINKLEPAMYRFNRAAYPEMNLPEGRQFGFIAQELADVFPELVHQSQFHNEDGDVVVDYKSVDYISMVAILTSGIQELSADAKAKEAKIAELEKRLTTLELLVRENKDTESRSSNAATIDGTGKASLSVNQPNPFSQRTTIPYFLPMSVQEATLLVFDASGKEVSRISLADRGEGQVELTFEQMNAGTYFYTIQADGQQLPMQKMTMVK